MGRKGLKKADIWLSVGPNCRAVAWLRDTGLTRLAAPSDWLLIHDADTLLKLYKSRFSGVLEEIEEYQPAGEREHRFVRDVRHDVLFMHHFETGKPLEEERVRVREQVLRRAQKTHTALLCSRAIGLVSNWEVDREELCKLLKGFARMYPCRKITLYNLRHDPEQEGCWETETVLSPRLTLVEYLFDDTAQTGNPKGWRGNRERWVQILGQFSLSIWGRLCRKLAFWRHREG